MNSLYNLLPPNSMQYNVTEAIEITISDLVPPVDAVVKDGIKPLVDFTLSTDSLAKAITDKRLTEDVRMNDWFSEKNNPQSDPWA